MGNIVFLGYEGWSSLNLLGWGRREPGWENTEWTDTEKAGGLDCYEDPHRISILIEPESLWWRKLRTEKGSLTEPDQENVFR